MRYSFLVLLIHVARCHISLISPPARFPALDFLDSARTHGPCGVPKPPNPDYTVYVVGESLNVTWNLHYPNQGGFRISLLDKDGRLLEYLTKNGSNFVGHDDQTTENYVVRFMRSCPQCTLLIERQGLEMGPDYIFRSCADVNVQASQPDDEEACLNRGSLNNGKCDCSKGWEGDRCQFKVECKSNSDCGSAGLCVLQEHQLIQRVCACPYGYFGTHCQRRYPADSNDCFAYEALDDKLPKYGMFNPECYNSKHLENNDTIYFRKQAKDVEIIMDFETKSWLGLGWRPLELSSTCRLFPDLEGVTRRRRRRRQANTTAKNASVIEDLENDFRMVALPDFNDREGQAPKLPDSNGMLDAALDAPLHAMDCVDMITASVIDGRLHIRDMYSRDRSTPLDDLWYEGEDSLVAAAGIEVDGRTIVMFRRWSQEIEPSDHPLGPGPLHVVWAKGQPQGDYSHAVPSGLDGSRHSNLNFYKDDVLKYHGNLNRGSTIIDFHVSVPGRPEPEVPDNVKFFEVKPLLPTTTKATTTTSTGVVRDTEDTQATHADQDVVRLKAQRNTTTTTTSTMPSTTTNIETTIETELPKTNEPKYPSPSTPEKSATTCSVVLVLLSSLLLALF